MDGLTPGCVLLDVRMPGVDGMYLLEHMIRARMPSPIVMMTGHGDVPLAVKAIKLGAFDFLEKPFDDVKLVSILQNAFVQLRSEEHTSELQSLMRISYAVFCLKKKKI